MIVAAAFSFCSCEKDNSIDNGNGQEEKPEEQPLKLAPAHDTVFEINGIGFLMKYVPSGSFTMGAVSDESSVWYDPDADPFEQPAHTVYLNGFLIGELEVTQFLYRSLTGTNPSDPRNLEMPVNNLDYNKVLHFIGLLNEETGFQFRLPTEAEWEYAAKGGGQGTQGLLYSGSNDADSVGWSQANSNGELHRCGSLKANALGLYDMSGNVREWCSDWYGGYSSETQYNPRGPEKPTHGNLQRHAVRGGSYMSSPLQIRNTARQFLLPEERDFDLGIRLVISVRETDR